MRLFLEKPVEGKRLIVDDSGRNHGNVSKRSGRFYVYFNGIGSAFASLKRFQTTLAVLGHTLEVRS